VEAAAEKRVKLLSGCPQKARLKVLVLGNYYACRVNVLTRELVLLSVFVDFLLLSSFQCIADMECGGLPPLCYAPACPGTARARHKTKRGKPRSAEAFGPQKARPMKARAKLSRSKFPAAGLRLAPSLDFRLTNTLL
jgi:hypothetical protein